jgi:hypothetical protein
MTQKEFANSKVYLIKSIVTQRHLLRSKKLR